MDEGDLPPNLTTLINACQGDIAAIMAQLQAGTLTPEQWRERMETTLTRYHRAAMITGMGGGELSPEMVDILEHGLAVQFDFLDNFMSVIRASGDWQNAWNSRAAQYGAAIKTNFWEGEIVRQAGRPLPIAALPGQGTICGSNCLCKVRVVILDADAGNFDVFWERHAKDSCQTCVIRGQEWYPMKIRDGILIDED